MADNKETKIIGYKKIFGFVLPDWVSEKMIKKVIAGLLTLAVMLLVLILVIWPGQTTIGERKTQLRSDQASLDVLKKSRDGLARMKSELSENEQLTILSAMPGSYSPENAIFTLRRLSQSTGVVIVSYSLPAGVLLDTAPTISGTKDTGEMVDFVSYPIRITVAAPVENLLNFILAVESSLPFGLVSDLNVQEVTKLTSSVNKKTVQMALEVQYFQSILKKVNINKVQPLSDENLRIARQLLSFGQTMVTSEVNDTMIENAYARYTASGSASIFGF